MADADSPRPAEPAQSSESAAPAPVVPNETDEGPGWLPAILAGTVLLGILGFVFCGVSTWVLFQKRTELAARTLRGSFVPQLEQSLLEPDEKEALIERIETLVQEMEGGKYENWQSSAVMQRLQRLPIVQWGELSVVEAFLDESGGGDAESGGVDRQAGSRTLSRLRRGVELGKVTAFDFEDILEPVMEADERSAEGRSLIRPLTAEAVADTLKRADRVADRAEVPEKDFDVSIDDIVRREIASAVSEGGY